MWRDSILCSSSKLIPKRKKKIPFQIVKTFLEGLRWAQPGSPIFSFRLIIITGFEAYDWLFLSHKPTPRQGREVIDNSTKSDWCKGGAIT